MYTSDIEKVFKNSSVIIVLQIYLDNILKYFQIKWCDSSNFLQNIPGLGKRNGGIDKIRLAMSWVMILF